MIDFIIYEKDYELNNFYKMIIFNFLGCRKEEFKIYDYEDINKSTSSNKIYILRSINTKKCLKIAKDIRTKGDWYSQIIILNETFPKIKNNHLLILDYIQLDDNLKENLKIAIKDAYQILTTNRTFKFLLNGEIHIIPYRDILYIEKGNNQNYCTIFTKNKSYIVKETINSLETKLDKSCFMKTHRSCIVNLNNITSYNYSDNIIYFDNLKIYMISREKRKHLKEKLLTHQINY